MLNSLNMVCILIQFSGPLILFSHCLPTISRPTDVIVLAVLGGAPAAAAQEQG